MLYLIFTRADHGRPVLFCWIYSFFIFGPLQEVGNVINIYRETEVSLNNFENILDIPKEPRPAQPVAVTDVSTSNSTMSCSSTSLHQRRRSTAFRSRLPGRDGCVRRAVRFRKDDAGQTAGRSLPAAGRRHPVRRLFRQEVDLDELREQIGLVTQDTQLFSGTIRENLLFVNPTATTRTAWTC